MAGLLSPDLGKLVACVSIVVLGEKAEHLDTAALVCSKLTALPTMCVLLEDYCCRSDAEYPMDSIF